MKQIFKNPIKVLAISLMALAGSITANAQVKVGANPVNITTNSVLDVEGSSAQRTVILQNGNMGVNQPAPTNKLHVKDATNPVRFEGLQQGDISQQAVLTDASGVLKLQSIKYIATGTGTTQSNLTNSFVALNLNTIVNGSASVFTGNSFIAPEAGTYEIEISVAASTSGDMKDGGTIGFSVGGVFSNHIYFGLLTNGGVWTYGDYQIKTVKVVANLTASQSITVQALGYGNCNGNNRVKLIYFSAQKIKN